MNKLLFIKALLVTLIIITGFTLPSEAYDIAHSCRFNDDDSAYLSRSWSDTESSSTLITISMWIKRGNLGSWQYPLTGYYSSTNNCYLGFSPEDKLSLHYEYGGTAINFLTTQVFQDASTWFHIFIVMDSSLTDSADRVKLWINGIENNTWDTYGVIPANGNLRIVTDGYTTSLGQCPESGGIYYFDGYLAEVHVLDGLTGSINDFGENLFGQWFPKGYTGGYGHHGFYVNYADSADLGDDVSGNNNHFIVNNLTPDDQVPDTPTNNMCVLDSSNIHSSFILADGNLKGRYAGSNWFSALGTLSFNSGKWYAEATIKEVLYFNFGVTPVDKSTQISEQIGSTGAGWALNAGSTSQTIYRKIYDSAYTSLSGTPSVNDIMQIAVDADAGKIWFGVNGTWLDGGDPSTGTNEAFSGLSGDLTFGLSSNDADTGFLECNFGQLDFQYTPPTGFKALSSVNIETPQVSFTASPNPINFGDTSTLTWSTYRADAVTIEPDIGSVAANGTQDVSPTGDITYTLTATNTAGTTAETVTITVNNGYDIGSDFTISGNLGVGVHNPTSKLEVNGTIKAKEVIVTLDGWPDFVFRENYDLPTLESVEAFIKKNNHLPGIPDEKRIIANGLYMSDMVTFQMQKIEELTLYMIELKKENTEFKQANEKLKKDIENKNSVLEELISRIELLEKR